MTRVFFLFLAFVAFSSVASSQSVQSSNNQFVSKVWVADNGDGTYKNPILHADYSDPDVIRVGDDFYLVASSFNHAPGLPILHSKDLVNWTLINHALKRQPPFDVFDKPQTAAESGRPRFAFTTESFSFSIQTRSAAST